MIENGYENNYEDRKSNSIFSTSYRVGQKAGLHS